MDKRVFWTASDIAAAAECEYGLLRALDYRLGWAEEIDIVADPLTEHIATLGERHEAAMLADFRATHEALAGTGAPGVVVEIERVLPPYTEAKLRAAAAATAAALDDPETAVVYQAAFFDGDFFGYADFVERRNDGWGVSDAKLARQAKPRALLQLGAYVSQLRALGVQVSDRVSLLLGTGEREDFRVADILPVFGERRGRLLNLFDKHIGAGSPVAWGDDRVVACGACDECRHAAAEAEDIILVAGLRMEQRRRLRNEGVQTVADLATAQEKPQGMAPETFTKLRAQARLQWHNLQGGDDAPLTYEFTPTAETILAALPAPSEGDLFFDFEGDPLYGEDNADSWFGLEYLWGTLDTHGRYEPIWAHDSAGEREALIRFMDGVAGVREQHPDMHIYHYAPYETSALKRLVARYQIREKELDDLLRSEVFVDLYATVRGSVLVSTPSYSIKKLEPLYMGDELRSDDDESVSEGGASVVAYQAFREERASDPAAAARRLDALADYNRYDCLSTLRLRAWLLDRARELDLPEPVPRTLAIEGEELSDQDPVFVALMEKAGEKRSGRTAEQQAHAMLATSIDYYRRERKQFWWEHFDRLIRPVADWRGARDLFIVESTEVVQDWRPPEGRQRNWRRCLRLIGDWTPGSKDNAMATEVYERPGTHPLHGPEGAIYGACRSVQIEHDPADPRVVLVTETCKPGETFAEHPVALVPASPPRTTVIEEAIKEVCGAAAESSRYPESAALDILARRAPRLRAGARLPDGGDPMENVVAALRGMDDSYVAIQGPPGTGKTYTGSRVIKELVEGHGWRVGVVAQSHAVVENMLTAIVKAGLDPALVGKSKNGAERTWTDIPDNVKQRAEFLSEHQGSGCVLGGTAWTFAHAELIERGGLDLLVIDEAGQFSLAPTLGVSVAAKRLLLLGDPQQLPQVTQGTHAEPVDESALGWLLGEQRTIPGEFGYFLAETYRMHPALCEKVSVLAYEGRLTSAPAASARSLETVEPGLTVVEVEHVGNRTESPEEAIAVVGEVKAHLGRLWTNPDDPSTPRPLSQQDVLVVAPYNAQVALIRRAMDRAGLRDVRVGTVDKFQGQEAALVIFSTTASSHGDVPRGMGFLLNRNRVNVSVSRGQWKAVIVRSAALTAYMPTSTHGLLDLGAFIGLCKGSGRGRAVGPRRPAGRVHPVRWDPWNSPE
ncbi:MAG TPA: TM0106 family RecB-like putative nuclease [Actinomycetaceae bacterium]|nr:TM0106 family RecB-like putative nuclease [Actinomycetaceae bacterium]